jgi:hypothetical protein
LKTIANGCRRCLTTLHHWLESITAFLGSRWSRR